MVQIPCDIHCNAAGSILSCKLNACICSRAWYSYSLYEWGVRRSVRFLEERWCIAAVVFIVFHSHVSLIVLFGMQGFVPPALGKQLALESADLSGNLLSGPIDALASEIIDESRLYRLNLANNRLTGPVSGLGKLGVFKEVLPGDRSTGTVSLISTHVLNISSNSFQGELPFAFYGAASVGGPARLPRLDVRVSNCNSYHAVHQHQSFHACCFFHW